jgi:hypothetical protein
MNVYFVLSETLTATIPILDDGTGPEEQYAICELVAARSRSQARWMAWKTDKHSWTGDPADMPRFNTQLLRKGVDRLAGLVTHAPELQDLWQEVKEVAASGPPLSGATE